MSLPQEHCCNKCLNPRTYANFMKNHLRPAEVDKQETCGICLNTYGTRSETQGHTDDALQVFGVGSCRHVFGQACIEDLKMSENEQRNRCPLCREIWWFDFGLTRLEEHPVQVRETFSRNMAEHYATDYATVRFVLYHESEYEGKQLPIAVELFETHQRWWNSIHDAISDPHIQSLLESLVDGEPIALDEPLPTSRDELDYFFEWEPFCLRWWWKWSPWQIANLVLDDIMSFRGKRLLETYKEQALKYGGASSTELDAIERAWMNLFPDDPADCIRFELEVFAIAFPLEEEIFNCKVEGYASDEEILEIDGTKWQS